MKKSFYKGNYEEDARFESVNPRKDKWWLMGHFFPDSDGSEPRKTQNFALKYTEFSKGEEGKHEPKIDTRSLECNLVLGGSTRGLIGDQEVIVKTGEYVVISPRTPSNLVVEVLEEPLKILTIKAPNIPEEDTIKLGSFFKKLF